MQQPPSQRPPLSIPQKKTVELALWALQYQGEYLQFLLSYLPILILLCLYTLLSDSIHLWDSSHLITRNQN